MSSRTAHDAKTLVRRYYDGHDVYDAETRAHHNVCRHRGTLDEYPLKSVSVAVWEGCVFISLAQEPEPFEQAFAPLMDKFGSWTMDELESMIAAWDREYLRSIGEG